MAYSQLWLLCQLWSCGLFVFQRNTQERDGRWGSLRPTPEAVPAAEAAVLGPAAAALVQELSEQAMKKKTLSIVDEYLNIRDVKVGHTGSMMVLLFLGFFVVFLFGGYAKPFGPISWGKRKSPPFGKSRQTYTLYVNYDHPGECSPEKDCLRWLWLTFWQPERKSSSESSELWNVSRWYICL